MDEIIIWPGVCGKSPQLYAHLTVTVFVQFSIVGFAISSAYLRVRVCARARTCVRACMCVRMCVYTHLLDTCSAVPCLAAMVLVIVYHFLPIFLCLFFFFPPLSVVLFFCFFSLYLLVVLLALVPMPRPPLWHHGWLCPIRSAAGERGEWDAGSSESGAGSHHTVFRPRNVSGTPTINCAASLSPLLFLLPENYHTGTSLCLPGANSA